MPVTQGLFDIAKPRAAQMYWAIACSLPNQCATAGGSEAIQPASAVIDSSSSVWATPRITKSLLESASFPAR
jgi:hypothetical protein